MVREIRACWKAKDGKAPSYGDRRYAMIVLVFVLLTNIWSAHPPNQSYAVQP
jgi:hypothetical protein